MCVCACVMVTTCMFCSNLPASGIMYSDHPAQTSGSNERAFSVMLGIQLSVSMSPSLKSCTNPDRVEFLQPACGIS